MSNSTLTVFESFEFADLYAGLRTLPSVFASKILACPDFDANVNKAAIKETWDFFWENAGDHTRAGCDLLRFLEKAETWEGIQAYMLSAVHSNSTVISVSRQKKEFLFESKLEAFLQVNGIEVERQVASNQKRIDLWIPGQLMIECKAGKVTGDDICQAVDYLATFERDVLLIGTGMTSAASRGIEAINKLSSECKLLFVTQEACFGYLKTVCK